MIALVVVSHCSNSRLVLLEEKQSRKMKCERVKTRKGRYLVVALLGVLPIHVSVLDLEDEEENLDSYEI